MGTPQKNEEASAGRLSHKCGAGSSKRGLTSRTQGCGGRDSKSTELRSMHDAPRDQDLLGQG